MKIKALISTTLAAALATSVMALSASAASFTKTADVGVNHFDMGHVSGTVAFSKTSFTSGTQLTIDFSALFDGLKSEALDAGALEKTNSKLALANVTLNGAPVGGSSSKIYLTSSALQHLNFGLSSDSGNIASGNYTNFTFGASALIVDKDGKAEKDETQKLAEFLKDEAKEFDHVVNITANGGRVYGNDDTLNGIGSTNFTDINGGKVSISKIKYDGLQTGDAGEVTQQEVTFDFRTNVSDNEKFTTAEKAVLKRIHTVELELGLRGASTTGKTVKVTLVPKDADSEVRIISYSAVPKGATSVTINLPATEFYDTKYGEIFDGKLVVANGAAESGNTLKFTSAKLLFADDGSTSGGSDVDVSGKVDSQVAQTTTAAPATTPAATTKDEPEDAEGPEDNEVPSNTGSNSSHVGTPEEDSEGFNGGDVKDQDADKSGTGTDTAGTSTEPGTNPRTGIVLAIAPALVAGAAVVVSRKKK